jgi:hypothetical protein
MRRIVVLGLVAILVSGAQAQRRGGAGVVRSGMGGGFARGGIAMNRGRVAYGFGYGYAGYAGYDGYSGGGPVYMYAPLPVVMVTPQTMPEPAEAPLREAHSVVTDYKRSAGDGAVAAAGDGQPFGIVLKDGETLAATMVVAEGDVLHYVDPDERNMRVALSEIDRAATRKLNAERKLVLHLPVAGMVASR